MRSHLARRFSFAMIVILLLGMLSACGKNTVADPVSSSGSNVSAGTDTNSQSANSANSGNNSDLTGTITYQAANGEVEIPKNPQRVVVLADSYVGYFLALGIEPVGVSQHVLSNPYFKGHLDGIENLGEGKSVEKILELQPDLIVEFAAEDTAHIDNLSKIAPTVGVEYGKLPLREQMLEFGKMTGKEDEAKEWISKWDQLIADNEPKVKAAVGDQTVSILQPYSKGVYAFGHNYARGGEIIYGEFQLKAPELLQKEAIDSGTGWASISLEVLPDYAGDFIFTSPWSGDDANPDVVFESTIWKDLSAVKNNRVFPLDAAGSYFNDPISLEAQLEFIVESLTQ